MPQPTVDDLRLLLERRAQHAVDQLDEGEASALWRAIETARQRDLLTLGDRSLELDPHPEAQGEWIVVGDPILFLLAIGDRDHAGAVPGLAAHVKAILDPER